VNALGDELRFFLITSAARVTRVPGAPEGAVPATMGDGGVWLRVSPSDETKCIRCWHHRVDVGAVAEHPQICARCAGNVDGPGEERRFT